MLATAERNIVFSRWFFKMVFQDEYPPPGCRPSIKLWQVATRPRQGDKRRELQHQVVSLEHTGGRWAHGERRLHDPGQVLASGGVAGTHRRAMGRGRGGSCGISRWRFNTQWRLDTQSVMGDRTQETSKNSRFFFREPPATLGNIYHAASRPA